MNPTFQRILVLLCLFFPTFSTADIIRCVVPDSMHHASLDWVVDIAGDYAVLGQLDDYDRRGAAYVYHNQANGDWEIQASLLPGGAEMDPLFGSAVALCEGRACVLGYQGVYVFHQHANGTWGLDTLISFPEGWKIGGNRGATMRMNRERIFVGLPEAAVGEESGGMVLVYAYDSTMIWHNEAQFPQSAVPSRNKYGKTMHVSDSVLVVSTGYSTSDSGGVSAFALQPSGVWKKEKTLRLSSPATAVSCTDTSLLVAYRDNDSLYILGHSMQQENETVENIFRDFKPDGCTQGVGSMMFHNGRFFFGMRNCLTSGAVVVFEQTAGGWRRERMLVVPELTDNYDFLFHHIGLQLAASDSLLAAGVSRLGAYPHDIGVYMFDLTNSPPTDISFAPVTDPDNPRVIGELTVIDTDENDTYSYRFPHPADTMRFTTEGNLLMVRDSVPVSTLPIFKCRVMAIDQDGAAITKLVESSNTAVTDVRIPIPENTNYSWHQTCHLGTAAFVCQDAHPDGYNVYYWNGRTTQPITSNMERDMHPSLYDGTIAWVHRGSGAGTVEIKYWDGVETHTIDVMKAQNMMYVAPSLYNGKIAYGGWDGNDLEIFFWDGNEITQITDNQVFDAMPSLYKNTIAWVGMPPGGKTREIMYFDGSDIRQITTTPIEGHHVRIPSLSNGQITWYQWDGNDYETFFWDGTTIHQLSRNSFTDRDPIISNGEIAWHIKYGQKNGAIAYFDGQYTYIMDTPYHVPYATISDGEIVYSNVDKDGNYGLYYLNARKNKNPAMVVNTDMYYSNPTRIASRATGGFAPVLLPVKPTEYIMTVFDLSGKMIHRERTARPRYRYRHVHASHSRAYIVQFEKAGEGESTCRWGKHILVK